MQLINSKRERSLECLSTSWKYWKSYQRNPFSYKCRAVATGPVSLVQLDHFFPHSWLAWHCQLAPLHGGRPYNAPKHTGTMLKLARWLRTVRQNCSASLPTTFRSCKWTIASLASFTCEGCGFRPINELDRKPTPLVYNAMGRMAFMCNSVIWPQSEKHRIGPKMVSEAISNFKIFLGGKHARRLP